MHAPVADTPNNWVQVRHEGDSYVAAVGQETFDVELSISLESGRILRATMVNPVETVVRWSRYPRRLSSLVMRNLPSLFLPIV